MVVLPLVPVTPINVNFEEGLSKKFEARQPSALLVFFTCTYVTSFLISFGSVDGFTCLFDG